MAERSPDAGRAGERGSVLLLMPAALLIVIGLGAIAIDASVRFQAQREAVADAQSIAHDLASAISPASLRTGTDPAAASLDSARARHRAARVLQVRRVPGEVTWRLDAGVVTVQIERNVELVFRGAVPGASGSTSVRATATATLVTQEPS